MADKRQYFIRHYDWIRRALMFEPRGHDLMSGSFIFLPNDTRVADLEVLFIETSGCLPMCGHGLIGTLTVALQEGFVRPKRPGQVRVATPAGLVDAEYVEKKGDITSVKVRNVPAYLAASDLKVQIDPLGELSVDVAYGGNFYAIVDKQKHFSDIGHYTSLELVDWSRRVRKQLNEAHRFVHPLDERIHGLSHVMWDGVPLDTKAHARNAVFYGDKAIDRSPCGTGTSARMAQRYTKGWLKPNTPFIHESIIGSQFVGCIEQETKVADHAAIVPSIQGWARITGYNQIIVDDADPYAHGFQVL